MDALAEQLLRLVDVRLLDPLEILLEDADVPGGLRTVLRRRAAVWADTIRDGDHAAAVRTIARIIATLYPDEQPFSPPADWWRTPFGQAVVRRVGHPYAESVSYATAGAMLGISRQGVHDLVRRGRLPRHPDGGVPVTAVRDRLLSNFQPDIGPEAAGPLFGADERGPRHVEKGSLETPGDPHDQ